MLTFSTVWLRLVLLCVAATCTLGAAEPASTLDQIVDKVVASVRAERDAEHKVAVLRDATSGTPPALYPAIVRRFSRAKPDTDGALIGLAYFAALARIDARQALRLLPEVEDADLRYAQQEYALKVWRRWDAVAADEWAKQNAIKPPVKTKTGAARGTP